MSTKMVPGIKFCALGEQQFSIVDPLRPNLGLGQMRVDSFFSGGIKRGEFGMGVTLPKTNIAAENRPLQKESSLSTTIFQGRTVSSRECNTTVT